MLQCEKLGFSSEPGAIYMWRSRLHGTELGASRCWRASELVLLRAQRCLMRSMRSVPTTLFPLDSWPLELRRGHEDPEHAPCLHQQHRSRFRYVNSQYCTCLDCPKSPERCPCAMTNILTRRTSPPYPQGQELTFIVIGGSAGMTCSPSPYRGANATESGCFGKGVQG